MRYCKTLWGGSSLHCHPLRTIEIHDAVYIPFSDTVFFDSDPSWGIYTNEGMLVPEAAYMRGEALDLCGQSRARDLHATELEDAPFDTMIYGGPVIPHYGHFLISTLARLHAFDGKTPVLFHSFPPIFDHGLSFIREILRVAGLTPANCASFSRPCRIPRLLVPEPAIVEQAYVSPAYADSLSVLGSTFPHAGRFARTRCYLSKSRLPLGIARLADEEVVEAAFAEAGFDIVYPETLTVAEQVTLFRSADVVAGTVGSALHSLALAPRSTATRVLFNYSDTVISNFSLIDHGARGRSFYFSIQNDVEQSTHPDFMKAYRAIALEKLAAEMVAVTLAAARNR